MTENQLDSYSLIPKLKQNANTFVYSQCFDRRNHINEIFLRKIEQLMTSGVTKKLEDDTREILKRAKTKADENEGPKQLTFDHLGLCFVAIAICLALSCIVFVLECLTKYFTDLWIRYI
jgi:hypothetical protein